jgi:hypothetical protein
MDRALTLDSSSERRRTPRRSGRALAWVRELRLQPRLKATLINLSEEGAVVETSTSLRPGARTGLQLTGASGGWHASGRVTRSWVASVVPERGVRYRGAVVFDRRVDLSRAGSESVACGTTPGPTLR